MRDLLAWMRLIAVPADNVACARVLAAPYWGLEPRDLVRLAERAEKNHRRPLWDEVESAQREPPLDRAGSAPAGAGATAEPDAAEREKQNG